MPHIQYYEVKTNFGGRKKEGHYRYVMWVLILKLSKSFYNERDLLRPQKLAFNL